MMSAKKFFLLHCAPLLCMLKISFTFHFPFRSSSFEFFFFSFFSLKTKSLRMWRWMKLPMMMLVNQQTAHFQLCLSCTTAYSQSCVSFSHSLSTLCGVEFFFFAEEGREIWKKFYAFDEKKCLSLSRCWHWLRSYYSERTFKLRRHLSIYSETSQVSTYPSPHTSFL